MSFLVKTTEVIIANAAKQLDSSSSDFPEITVIAVGPAGRTEYSPCCSLQFIMIHGEVTPTQRERFNLFCSLLHDEFEASGFNPDPIITARNPEWRGTQSEWQQRCVNAVNKHEKGDLINLCRLVDQYPLYNPDPFAVEFKQNFYTLLANSNSAVTNLIERMTSLPSGVGLMGRLKLERSGKERGLFRLLDHGLLPFSASLSVLSLLTGGLPTSSCKRISELLRRGKLDVELAERMLATWQTLHALRLWLERPYITTGMRDCSLCIDPKELTHQQMQLLSEALESVAVLKRHVGIISSGMRE